MCEKQRGDKDQGRRKGDISDPFQLFSWLFRHFVRKKIQHHRRPAGIAAPAASEDQRAEDFCHCVVDRCGFKHTCEQVVPEALDLHIFAADQPKIDQHIQPDKQLDDAPGMFVVSDKKEHAQGDRAAYVAEIKEVENVSFGQPQRNGYCFEDCQHEQRHRIFLHG